MADTEAMVNQLNECVGRADFDGAFKLVCANREELAKRLQAVGLRDLLKKATSDRLITSFIDGAEFDVKPLDKALVGLEKLVSFQQGANVLSKAWGLGVVRRVDYFYRRITVDFKTKPGHQFTYAAAVDMLVRAPDNHILVMQKADPDAFAKLLKEKPAEFVKKVLESYGDMTVVKLEDVCVANGFVKRVNWKAFWDGARAELRQDKLVEIPAKRSEPIRLKESAESYGDGWLAAFSKETDPKLILAAVREYDAQGKFAAADDAVKSAIESRLSFAVTAARKVDDALYARLACQVQKFGFANPPAAEMREYLRERRRYIKAAVTLPSREVGAMIAFLADGDEAKARLYAALPDFCFAAVSEVISQLGNEPACRAAVAELLRSPQAPATLVTLVVGKWEAFMNWQELPSLSTVLTHAIALGEGRQGGETLKMQNIIRRLFVNSEWLKKVFGWLPPAEQVRFFERFQASIAWDPATHHTIVVRMTRIVPALEAHVVKIEKKKEYARLTSYRSFGLRKQEYLKLINEEMPENVKRIEFAKSYGDLSENAEYQYAKDEQRALMQKQTLMQADLEAVKPSDFADATTDEVMPGVTVVIAAAGGEKTYTILGEWDNDLDRGILSSKTRVAQNLLGKKVGDSFELPNAEGEPEFATVRAILPLTDEIRDWMKLPEGVQI